MRVAHSEVQTSNFLFKHLNLFLWKESLSYFLDNNIQYLYSSVHVAYNVFLKLIILCMIMSCFLRYVIHVLLHYTLLKRLVQFQFAEEGI